MIEKLKQKRVLVLAVILLLVVAGIVGYFVTKSAKPQPGIHTPVSEDSKQSDQDSHEGAENDDPEKDANTKEEKAAQQDKPPANNSLPRPQAGGGGQSPGGSGGGGSSTPPPQGVLLGWQLTSQNTGLAPHGLGCDSLPVYGGPGKPAAGAVISQKRIETPLDLSEGNITIEKSCVRPTSAGLGLPILTTTDYNDCNPDCAVAPGPVTVRDSEIDGTLLGAQESAFATGFIGIGSFYRNYIHGLGSGIAIANAGQSFDSIVEGNYVTGLTAFGDPGTTGNHSDAFTIRDFVTTSNPGRQALVKNNRFDCNSGNDTGAIFIQQTWGDDISNVTIEGNLLEGGGYQLQLEGNTYGTNMKAVNNRFSGTGYGPAAKAGSGPGWGVWTNNYLNNPSAAGNQGSPVSEP